MSTPASLSKPRANALPRPRLRLRLARAASLALSFAFGIAGLATGINALVRSNHAKSALRTHVPPGTSVDVDTHDITAAGIALTVANGFAAVLSLLALFHAALAHTALVRRTARARYSLNALAGHFLAFAALFLFAVLVPFTDFVARRQARVSASLGGVQLPAAVIQAAEAQYGLTPVYHKLHYLIAGTVVPWFTFLFTVTSSALSYVYARASDTYTATPDSGVAPPAAEPSAPLDEKRAADVEKA